MKLSNLNTHIGSISIDNEVVAQYAGSVAYECFGIVGMAGVNMTEGFANLLKRENMTQSVQYKVEEFTGTKIEKINIYVEGVRLID